MPKCTIDGKEIEFEAGTNLIEVAKKAGVEVPYFCYHPALSVVAQCRMCAVEIEGMPKLQTACSTPAAEGMKVHTKSERAKKNQESVMEFLLVNHPLDCSICDEAGECDLQDISYHYGSDQMRSTEERRTFIDEDMGPVIKKNMNRCIHCTRCIRYAAEITGIPEMVAIQRGNHTEISTIDGKPLQTEYAGNYADVCPTGSLTLKDFRFRKRSWFLKKTETVCEGCSRGCNMEAHTDEGSLFRCIPRENQAINKYWLCDEGRFNFRYVQDESRITRPWKKGDDLETASTEWSELMPEFKKVLSTPGTQVLLGSDLTLEEMKALLEYLSKNHPKATVSHFGNPNVKDASQDGDKDKILKRLSTTSNLHGAEKLGIKPFHQFSSDTKQVVVIRAGKRSELPDFGSLKAYGLGVFFKEELSKFEWTLPTTTFMEKSGTVVNFQGVEQKFKQAIPPQGQSMQISEVLMMALHGSVPQRTEKTPYVRLGQAGLSEHRKLQHNWGQWGK